MSGVDFGRSDSRRPHAQRLASGSVDVGIDLVGDPVICDEQSEKSSDQPKDPAITFPGRAESGDLHGNIDKIGRAVTSVGHYSEDA